MGSRNPDPPPDSPVETYTVFFNGSILTGDEVSKAVAAGHKITAELFLAEGLSEPTLLAGLRSLVPGLPDGFLTAHLCDNLAEIDTAIDETQITLAKWSRAAAQRKDVWVREKRLRTSKNPFNVDKVDPVITQLDHERYDHITEPYRSYDPIYEFCDEVRADGSPTRSTTTTKAVEGTEVGPEEHSTGGTFTRATAGTGTKAKVILQDMVMHVAHECMSLYHTVSDDKLICKLQRIRKRMRVPC
jgi:hypothetical protein